MLIKNTIIYGAMAQGKTTYLISEVKELLSKNRDLKIGVSEKYTEINDVIQEVIPVSKSFDGLDLLVCVFECEANINDYQIIESAFESGIPIWAEISERILSKVEESIKCMGSFEYIHIDGFKACPEKRALKRIFGLMEEKKKIEQQVVCISDRLKQAADALPADILSDYSYEQAKDVYDSVKPYISNNATKEVMETIILKKKTERYPELLTKPTYYPEIDVLNISDSEKIRLDKALRANWRYHITKNSKIDKSYPISISDLELLKATGIVEKKYQFRCSECGDSCMVVSEDDLEKYKRLWDLESIDVRTDEQEDEIQALYDNGYFGIGICCLDCDYDTEISDMQSFIQYEPHIEVLYKITKQPDLRYERL